MRIRALVLAVGAVVLLAACSPRGTLVPNEGYAPFVVTLSAPARVGDQITIQGRRFGTADQGYVVFGERQGFGGVRSRAEDVVTWTSTIIVVRVPEGARTGDLYVVADGLRSNTIFFELR